MRFILLLAVVGIVHGRAIFRREPTVENPSGIPVVTDPALANSAQPVNDAFRFSQTTADALVVLIQALSAAEVVWWVENVMYHFAGRIMAAGLSRFALFQLTRCVVIPFLVQEVTVIVIPFLVQEVALLEMPNARRRGAGKVLLHGLVSRLLGAAFGMRIRYYNARGLAQFLVELTLSRDILIPALRKLLRQHVTPLTRRQAAVLGLGVSVALALVLVGVTHPEFIETRWWGRLAEFFSAN